MSRLQCRGSIAWAAVVVALLRSGTAGAQFAGAPGQPREPGGLVNDVVTGVQYDLVNQAKAEKRLQQVQAKLRRDAERGDPAAAAHDARKIENLKFRIVVDEWLIRKNSLLDPGCYPYPVRIDPASCVAIANATRPAEFLYPPQNYLTPGSMVPSMTPTPIMITIINAEPTGPGIAYNIDGSTRQSSGGSRQDLAVPPGSYITYDGGGSLGQRRYQMPPGVYEFRSTPEGWALYKLPSNP